MTDKITEMVKEKIENFTYGYVFAASDFPVDVTKQNRLGDVENPRGGVRGVVPNKQNYKSDIR